MMMMDMGMYGTYGKPDSYPNYGFANGHHQASVGHHHHHHHQSASSVGHVSVSSSPELAATAAHYYPQTASITPYSSTTSTSENFLSAAVDTNAATSSNTPPQSFYSSTGAPVLQEDGTAIISSENGLSYTNLDYANVSSSSSYASHGSCSTTDHHQSYPQQHVQSVYRTDEHRHHHPATLHHQVGTLHRQDHQELQTQPQQHHQSSHDSSEYQITPSYLHQLPVSEDSLQQHYGQSGSIRPDTNYPGHQHFKEEAPDHVVYHNIQQSSVHGVNPRGHASHVHQQHHHHHHQQHHHPSQSQHHQQPHPQQSQQQQQQQTQVPTYKWMQVKRNVPKPAGEFLAWDTSNYFSASLTHTQNDKVKQRRTIFQAFTAN